MSKSRDEAKTGDEAETRQERDELDEEDEELRNAPKHDNFADDLSFDYEEHRRYFDELFFKNSKLFKM